MVTHVRGIALQVWTILEILANMDLARLSELNVDAALNAFAADPWASPGDRPGDVSTRESISETHCCL